MLCSSPPSSPAEATIRLIHRSYALVSVILASIIHPTGKPGQHSSSIKCSSKQLGSASVQLDCGSCWCFRHRAILIIRVEAQNFGSTAAISAG